ncbi:MAG: DUF2796 domain-containing protein [Gammaproteobacteria bacterium]|nr:DUF2796 domain-containing protein [Gammaproteobacteria bacterium]
MTNRTTVGAMALVVGLGADAAETHGTHEHGHAVLKLAQEGTEVVVHFESPLDSIVGFEHEPENDEQRSALEEAMRLVQVPENILRMPTVCTSTGKPEVKIPHVGDDHDHNAADEHSDTDHEDHEAAGEGGDDHDAGEDAEVHADLEATFNFRCESGVEWLEATVFETFDGLEEVELQAVGPDAAVVETLTPASPRAALTGF